MLAEKSRKRKVKVGIVGVGNCASSFIQGLSYYEQPSANVPPAGLMSANIGAYEVRDKTRSKRAYPLPEWATACLFRAAGTGHISSAIV